MTKPIINEAREWLGTPWRHNQKQKGVGVDCIRFVEALAESQGWSLPAGAIPSHYSRSTQDDKMLVFLRQHCQEKPLDIELVEEGDILVLKYLGVPHHLGIASSLKNGRTGIIHARVDTGVSEQGFNGRILKVWIGLFSLTNH